MISKESKALVKSKGTSLTKSKERIRNHGEVFTPSGVVGAMHQVLPVQVWGNPSYIYLEPTCGNGQFLVSAIQLKIGFGLTILEACNSTFGMDILSDNIEDARNRIFNMVKSQTDIEDKKELKCILVNNIFHVDDSIAYIRDGRWWDKSFYKDDPTGGGQVLSTEEQTLVLKHVMTKGLQV